MRQLFDDIYQGAIIAALIGTPFAIYFLNWKP